ncbi:JM158 [macacine gammaherpesvirus 11]|uniref:JM158 n=2 Tax=macacine gammaherpesvirus 11 TaxID=2560570 RepID=G9JMY5_9GAMA|nr:JM158 [Macaca fuscata rhadinovirus]AAT00135.1 JM158 [Macaca fuscata rhadinovirus]AEW87682.1 JM158 [Macaca fuscata rhadinovirus]AEW87852.1 JM158 [Macaca fuscata rhadinovirus]
MLGGITLTLLLATLATVRCALQTHYAAVPVHSTASLGCVLTTAHNVLIVTWQKQESPSPVNVATYSSEAGTVVQPPFAGRVDIPEHKLTRTTLKFFNATMEDEGCYLCIFNAFGVGKLSGTACLTVYVPLSMSVTFYPPINPTQLVCRAEASPAPSVNWTGVPPELCSEPEVFPRPNGTTLVVGRCNVTSVDPEDLRNATCLVTHIGGLASARPLGPVFSDPLEGTSHYVVGVVAAVAVLGIFLTGVFLYRSM